MGVNFPVFARGVKANSADGVIQMKDNGKIYVHSGGGHGGPYAVDHAIVAVGRVMECPPKDVYVIMGGNPRQLPVFLGQHLNHLSFSSATTNKCAAEVLKAALKKRNKSQSLKPSVIIEDGVSDMTRSYIKSLAQEGIIVAVRQVD